MDNLSLVVVNNNEVSSNDQDNLIDAQLKLDRPEVDENLRNLQDVYGKDYLEGLDDRQLYQLYKKHI